MNRRQKISMSFVIVSGLTFGGLMMTAPSHSSGQPASQTSDGQSRQEHNKWMESKLRFSQEIFAALTRGDAKQIETNARRMLMVNIVEQWKVDKPYMDSSEYEAQLNAFEYATKELARTGKNNNISGACDAYVLLAKSCVKCHQLLRDADKAR